jgi:Serine incorporator (Serinc)
MKIRGTAKLTQAHALNYRYLYALVAFIFLAYAMALTMIGFLYAWFGTSGTLLPNQGCQMNQTYISLNLIACVIVTVISVLYFKLTKARCSRREPI